MEKIADAIFYGLLLVALSQCSVGEPEVNVYIDGKQVENWGQEK